MWNVVITDSDVGRRGSYVPTITLKRVIVSVCGTDDEAHKGILVGLVVVEKALVS